MSAAEQDWLVTHLLHHFRTSATTSFLWQIFWLGKQQANQGITTLDYRHVHSKLSPLPALFRSAACSAKWCLNGSANKYVPDTIPIPPATMYSIQDLLGGPIFIFLGSNPIGLLSCCSANSWYLERPELEDCFLGCCFNKGLRYLLLDLVVMHLTFSKTLAGLPYTRHIIAIMMAFTLLLTDNLANLIKASRNLMCVSSYSVV